MSLSENSPDESGYVIGSDRRNYSTSEEYDPSEHSYHSEDDTAESPARSLTPVSPRLVPAPPIAAHGMGFRTFARKRVPLPVRASFSAPTREVGESSRVRPRSVTPPPATGASAGRSPGITALESLRVSGLSRDIVMHQARLDFHHQSIDELTSILNTNNEFMDRALDVITATRRTVRRLHTYLAMVIGVLVVILGLLIWVMMQ